MIKKLADSGDLGFFIFCVSLVTLSIAGMIYSATCDISMAKAGLHQDIKESKTIWVK